MCELLLAVYFLHRLSPLLGQSLACDSGLLSQSVVASVMKHLSWET